MTPSPVYEVTVHSPRDLFFNAYILAGLYELRYQGRIRLKYRFTDFRNYQALPELIDFSLRDGWTQSGCIDGLAQYTVNHLASGRRRRIGFDLTDAADVFVPDLITQCDLVFKRHYRSQYIAQLPPAFQAKLHPAGLSYGVRSPHEYRMGCLYAAKWLDTLDRTAQVRLTRPRKFFKQLLEPLRQTRESIRNQRNFRSIPEFEADADGARESYVLFQTRCWKPLGNRKTNKHTLNEYRADLIRKLRNALGERFVGGFIPDDFTRQRYPDCLTTSPTDSRQYMALVKKASVVIYTQGVIASPAWKLPEYLAAAKCIVAEPLTAELPRPLVQNEDIIFYDSLDDCVQQCARLLDDPARVAQMSRRAQVYYRQEVEPSARVWQILEKAMDL